MAKITWGFQTYPGAVDLTSSVISFSRFRGKQNYLDNYTGQNMTVTIRNNTNQSASWVVGTAIFIYTASALDGQVFWITEVQYNDQIGTTTTSGSGSASTATVVLQDWMGRAGQIQLNSFTLTEELSYKQMWNQFTVASGALPSGMGWSNEGSGFFSAAAATYTGTIANRINLNLAGEKNGSQIYQRQENMLLREGNVTGSPITNAVTLQPAKSGSTGNKYIQYQTFKRITAGQNFLNTITVTPPVVAAQTATAPASVSAYGTKFNGISTVNTSISQAQNRAQWLANSQSDPYALRFEVSFSDVAQDNNGVQEMLTNYYSGSFIYLKYVVPGSGVTTTTQCNIEGIRYSATPDQTQFTLYLSPNTLYADFILNSSQFGVLDQNRLGNWYV
jgi:hypothetical protein